MKQSDELATEDSRKREDVEQHQPRTFARRFARPLTKDELSLVSGGTLAVQHSKTEGGDD